MSPPYSRIRVPLLGLAVAAVLALGAPQPFASPARAQGAGPVAPHTDGAAYAAETASGRTVSLFVERGGDGTADARLLVEPPAWGEAAGLDLSVAGPLDPVDDGWRLHGDTRRRSPASSLVEVEVVLPRMADGALDPLGVAEVTARGAAAEALGFPDVLRLTGIGTLLASETVLADGSLRVARRAPIFYREPWRDLDLVSFARLDVDRSVADGLRARHERPELPMGAWWDERIVAVQSLAPDLVSLRVENHVYSGGAHPNTHVYALNLMRGGDGAWGLASPCEVLTSLDRPCALAALRRAVVRDLARQEAAWVTDGQVNADTPWLLDLLTFTPTGLRVDFAPYAVGPYAQGVFTVHVPYAAMDGDAAEPAAP